MNVEKYGMIFQMAREYLLNFVSEDVLKQQLELGLNKKPNSIAELFRGLLGSLSNRGSMQNSIGDIDNLKSFLFDFEPSLIVEEYGDDWRRLFDIIKENYTPPTKMESNNKKSYWVIFVKGIISGAKFLSRFASIEDFADFVNIYYLNENKLVDLPMLLAQEIHGFGFALACDFLKENGYPKYIKPDVHIKYIFNGIGISNSTDDYQVFKDVIRFSREINEVPYVVDKMFWLIGSGNFYQSGMKIRTNRDEFIKKVTKSIK